MIRRQSFRSLFSRAGFVLILFALAEGVPVFAEEAAQEPLGLPPCAVNPEAKVNFRIFTDAEDGRVYFCCTGCCASFVKEATKYAEGVDRQREHLAKMERVQIKCPVTGKEIDPGVWFEYKGEKLAFYDGFACGDFLKDDKPFLANLKDCYTYQTKCPVSGKPVNIRKSFTLEDGLTVYFCCGNCCAAFAEDPGKYAASLKEQGYPIDIAPKEGSEAAPAAEEKPKEELAKVEGLPGCAVNPASKVDFTKFVLTDSGPVYFCCDNCKAQFEADPAKFTEGAEKQKVHLAALPSIQVACPISGKACNAEFSLDHEGRKVAFCCGDCCAAFAKEPSKYAAGLVGAFTYQVVCPVSGQPIDPAVSFDLGEGQKVYFCCGNCCAAFAKEPAKFADKVKEQGYKFDFGAKAEAAKAEEKPAEKAEAPAAAEAVEVVEAPKCVVNPGADINFAKFVSGEKGPVFFCCDGCKAKYEAEPSKFAEAAAEQAVRLAALPKSQIACPISGKACDPEFTFDYEGQKVAFCCGNCCAAFAKDPAAHASKLPGVFTYQTACPVSGKPINPAAVLDVAEGVNLYFCCQGCKAEYEGKPEKYAQALADQGFKF